MTDKSVEISTLADISYLEPEKAEFYILNDSFLALKYDGTDCGRVNLLRTFPNSLPDEYISVVDAESKEIGIIRRIAEFAAQLPLLKNELSLRYYCPAVIKIKSSKQKLGYIYLEVSTVVGERLITVKDIQKSILPLEQDKALIIDVDGNRYMIESLAALDKTSSRFINQLLL